ncbi:MAG: hypothetical protein ACRBK7_12220 [Acidimicrobiales bacterium]
MSNPQQAVQAVGYSEEWSWATLEGSWDAGDYPKVMTDTLAEAFSALEGWAIPLAAALMFRPAGDRFDRSIPTVMLLAEELDDDIELEDGWRTWAEPKQVEQITGNLVCAMTHERLRSLQQIDGRSYELSGIRFMAWRYAIGPDSLPEEFLLNQSYGAGIRNVRTTTANGKRWISEPQVGRSPQLLPVEIEITGTQSHDSILRFRMSPSWSYFGDKDSPGWPTIAAAADRLLAISDRWSVTILKPGDPDKR